MYSVGIDSIEIARIAESIKNEKFIKKVYGDSELREISLRGLHPRSFAVSFAAKEAFSKAIGTGIVGFSLNEVELLHNEFGAPYLFLSGKAKVIAEDKGFIFSTSVTHTESVATVIFLAYQEK